MTTTLGIRWMIQRDMPEILAMEPEWSEEKFFQHLRHRNCIGMVVEQGDKIVGYMVHELQAHSLEILNIQVHPEHRRSNIGTSMITKLRSKLHEKHRTKIIVRVPDTHLQAHLFFKAMGFRALKVIWSDSGDTYYMEYKL